MSGIIQQKNGLNIQSAAPKKVKQNRHRAEKPKPAQDGCLTIKKQSRISQGTDTLISGGKKPTDKIPSAVRRRTKVKYNLNSYGLFDELKPVSIATAIEPRGIQLRHVNECINVKYTPIFNDFKNNSNLTYLECQQHVIESQFDLIQKGVTSRFRKREREYDKAVGKGQVVRYALNVQEPLTATCRKLSKHVSHWSNW